MTKNLARTHVWIALFCGVVIALVGCAVTAAPTRTVTSAPQVTKTPKVVRYKKTLNAQNRADPTEAAGGAPRITQSPVTGAVTSNSADVILRTNVASQVALRYSTSADLSHAQTSAPQTTQDQHDFATRVSLQNLAPQTTYYLDVQVNGVSQLQAPYPSFTTFPPPGTATAFKFLIFNDFFWTPSATFRNATKENPAFVVIGGDLSHHNPNTLAQKRAMFQQRFDPQGKGADFVSLILQRYAVAHFWDDHDFGLNNADRTYPNKTLSLQALNEFFPTYPLTTHGDWQSFSYGNADFFLLDSRSQRDPDNTPDGPNKSMLDGEHLGTDGQYSWLTQGLLTSKATWKFIFTPVPFNPTVPKDDAWAGFKYERGQLVQFIRDHQIQNVIFLSGDLHAGAIDDGTNSDFPEMLVPPPDGKSCLTAPSPGKWSVGVYARPAREGCNGYGVVSVTTNPPGVLLQVKNQDGDIMLTNTIDGK